MSDIKKMREQASILPVPGDQVVPECIDEIEKLRALVLRQLRWQKHRDSVGCVMTGAELSWIEDAEAILGEWHELASKSGARGANDACKVTQHEHEFMIGQRVILTHQGGKKVQQTHTNTGE